MVKYTKKQSVDQKREECWGERDVGKNESHWGRPWKCSSKHRLGEIGRRIKQLVSWQAAAIMEMEMPVSLCLMPLNIQTLWARDSKLMKGASGFILASSVHLPTGSSYTLSTLISFTISILISRHQVILPLRK